jgi:acyl-homoserine lactone acylase PvdQ
MFLRFSFRALLLTLLAATQSSAMDALAARVTIYRDGYGVPHIVGDSEQATFFGYGYAQAQDHLERMMLQYRDAQGRLSEVNGRAALGEGEIRFDPREYRWGGDYLQRLLRTWQCVVDNKAKIDPIVYGLLDAFARGVNAYIGEHRAGIPAWIDRVSAEDIEALERSNYMRFYSSADGLEELTTEPERYLSFGSNQWAVSRAKSANGRILHGASVHMPWGDRFQLYEAHLITPGKLDVAGMGWFGSPFFLSGFTDRITWSVTYNRPNIADVYEEKISAHHPLQYLYEGVWRDMKVEQATFWVRDCGVSRLETKNLYYTHHGPVVKFDEKYRRAYSLKLPNFDGVNYSTGLYRLMKSHDLASFQAALAEQLIPRWNFLYTDASNLYWVHNGLVARRDGGFDKTRPMPGWTSKTEWGPYLPFSANPQIVNPRSGFLQNCNNPPWVVTRDSGLKPLDPTPYYLSDPVQASSGEEVLNARGQRLFGVLTRPRGDFTVDDFTALSFDTYVLAADDFVPLLLEAAARRQPIDDPRVSHAIELLRGWNRRSSEDSTAYTYVHYFAEAYKNLPWPAGSNRFSRFNRNQVDVHSRLEQYVAWYAFERAVRRVEQLYGKREVPWGEVNGVLRGTWLPVGGTADFDVLHPDKGDEHSDGRVYCNDGWGSMMVAMEGEPKQVWTLLPFGESEDPQSPHYADQARLHSSGLLKRFWITPAEILANTESVWGDRQRLKPATPAGSKH